MNKLTKLAAAVTLSAIVLGYAFPTEAFAQTVEQNQELNQTVRVNCSSTGTGAYGQNLSFTCNAEAIQRAVQHQKITLNGVECVVIKDQCIPTHRPVNTSVNTLTLSGIIAAAVTTASAGFLTIKKRK